MTNNDLTDFKDSMMIWDVQIIRDDFPALHQTINGAPLAYLDNAASTQKPRVVLESMADFYMNDYSNVHRGVHSLSQRATAKYEAARERVQFFINAREDREIIFTRGTTDSLNILAQSYGHSCLKAGDEIILTQMEHHSNIVPWQILRDQIGIDIKVLPMNQDGELALDQLEALISDKTRLISVTHISNVLGTQNPVEKIIELAHSNGVLVCLDAAQSIPHGAVDVQALDCDFLVFSGHKAYGPTGIGVLYGKAALLEKMTPAYGGGSMIETVTFEKTTYAGLPAKFEPGTPPIAEAIGLHAALDYLDALGRDKLRAYENELCHYAMTALKDISGVQIFGNPKKRAATIAFNIHDIHAHDAGTILDQEGVAVRAGHHCAMPMMNFYEVPAMLRASFGLYNTHAEVDALANAIVKAQEIFGL